MKIFDDGVADAMSKVVAATLPFITICLMTELPVWYSAVVFVIGVIALVALIVRVIALVMNKCKVAPGGFLNKVIGDLLAFPYAVALSSTIAIASGIDAQVGLSFAGLLAVLVVAGEIAALKKDGNQV